jgi:L-aminopeptidase/D-esterase-like protein
MASKVNSITDVPGILVGHSQNRKALTGCTVILFEAGATGGVDQRGGAPGTRETDALRPMHLVECVHAIILAGGSAFGLDAATGVMKYLEEKGIGYETPAANVPIVAGAILYDLAIGSADIRPDAEMGYQCCENAKETPPKQGNFGAGIGASIGKILGMDYAMKSGIGMSSIEISDGLIVGAIVAVNALGDVIDPKGGSIIAGARSPSYDHSKNTRKFADTLEIMRRMADKQPLAFSVKQNTVIGVIATNAKLNKEEANIVAQMAQNGLAITIRPTHTMLDGDTLFTMATNGYEKEVDVNVIGAFSVKVVSEAILNAVKYSQPLGGLPSASSYD